MFGLIWGWATYVSPRSGLSCQMSLKLHASHQGWMPWSWNLKCVIQKAWQLACWNTRWNPDLETQHGKISLTHKGTGSLVVKSPYRNTGDPGFKPLPVHLFHYQSKSILDKGIYIFLHGSPVLAFQIWSVLSHKPHTSYQGRTPQSWQVQCSLQRAQPHSILSQHSRSRLSYPMSRKPHACHQGRM